MPKFLTAVSASGWFNRQQYYSFAIFCLDFFAKETNFVREYKNRKITFSSPKPRSYDETSVLPPLSANCRTGLPFYVCARQARHCES